MSQSNHPNLTKTCSNCGLQKPLSAFLEMSGTEGSSYGNICSSCRKTLLEEMEKRKKTEAEGSSTSASGVKIDSKSKVQTSVNSREFINRTSEEYHAERKIDEEIIDNKQIRDFKTEASQKKHRQDILLKRTFLGSDAKTAGKLNAAQQLRTEISRGNEKAANQTVQQKEERIMKDHDFTVTQHGDQTGQTKFKRGYNQALMNFLDRITSAPIGKTVNQTSKATESKQTGAATHPETRRDPKKAELAEKDEAVKFIEDNWRRPGGKR